MTLTQTLLTAGLHPGSDLAVSLAFAEERWRIVLVGPDAPRLTSVLNAVNSAEPVSNVSAYRAHVTRDPDLVEVMGRLDDGLDLVHCHLDVLGIGKDDLDAVARIAARLPSTVRALALSISVRANAHDEGVKTAKKWLLDASLRAQGALAHLISVITHIDDIGLPDAAREVAFVTFLKSAATLAPHSLTVGHASGSGLV